MCYCKVEGCRKQAYYGLELKKPLACSLHRKKNYVNVTRKMCFCGKVRPSFGIEIGKATMYDT
jgi:hypothetical protein